MTTHAEIIKIKTKPKHFYDMTNHVKQIVKNAEVTEGICSVFSKDSTSTIILNENNPMLLADISNFLEKIVPDGKIYQHSDNTPSHIRSMLFSSNSQTIPIENGELMIGDRQSILFLELDVTEKEREISVTIVGE